MFSTITILLIALICLSHMEASRCEYYSEKIRAIAFSFLTALAVTALFYNTAFTNTHYEAPTIMDISISDKMIIVDFIDSHGLVKSASTKEGAYLALPKEDIIVLKKVVKSGFGLLINEQHSIIHKNDYGTIY